MNQEDLNADGTTKGSYGEEMSRILEEWSKAIEANNIEKASSAMNCLWMVFQMYVVKKSHPDLKEINYIKAPVTFANGGKYLLSLNHVDGPKIQMDDGIDAVTETSKGT